MLLSPHNQIGKRRPPRSHRRQGATLVEFAIIVVPMFTLIFACIEITRVYMIDSLAEDAAFECLRHVMVVGSTKQEAIDKAEEFLDLLSTQGYTVSITPYNNGTAQAEINDDTTDVNATITVDMSANTFVISWFTDGIMLNKSATMRCERYKGFYDGGAT